MKPTRIVLLVVAVLAAGLAAWLATNGGGAPAPTTEIVQVEAPKTQILVAAEQIGVGQRLTPVQLQWQDWPESAVRPEYVTISAIPDAPEQLTGTVARFEIFPGEPILETKLVRADQGYLSAVLEKGMRAVSIPVDAGSSAGGFIVPNDRVDVVQTLATEAGPQTHTVIENVKVLAIGLRLGERGPTSGPEEEQDPRTQVFQGATIATVELTPEQAEIMVTAVTLGSLSLVLRSIKDFDGPALVINDTDTKTIKLVRFGQPSSVVPNSSVGSSSSIIPVAAATPPAAATLPDYRPATPSPTANSGLPVERVADPNAGQ
ncbi:MAG: Flp pilus assembly protein CpaB [Alphaproteobacteria bacterium]|nr:Flp pilus assembly protein CpaB [Alphaproteobacteria bacterium]